MTTVSGRAEIQLGVLKQLDALLSSWHIRFWLRGGWALDFLLGRITRPHDDLDLVIWARHRERARDRLIGAGFRLTHETDVQVDFDKDDQEISFVFLARNGEGKIVARGIPEWAWRSDALPLRRLFLQGVSARIVNPQQLLDEKEGYERGTGRLPRSKDLDSMRSLRRLIPESKEP